MSSKKSIDFINIIDVQLPMLQGFLASIQKKNGSWDDLILESSLILEQFLKADDSEFVEIKKRGINFILEKIRSLAQEYKNNPNLKYSLDSNCIIYGQCLKTLSYVPNTWSADHELITSSYKKLEILLQTELQTLNNFSAVTGMLDIYATKLINPDIVTRKILSWLIAEILSGTHSHANIALMCTCLAKIHSMHKDLIEDLWEKDVKDRIDQWKDSSVEDVLDKLLESTYDNTKNQLSENYSLLQAMSSWSKNCENIEIQHDIKLICYQMDNRRIFARIFDYLQEGNDSLLLSDLASYLSVITENTLNMIGIRSDMKTEVEKVMNDFQEKSKNSQFIEKWKLKGLLTFAGVLSGISSLLLGIYVTTYGPWLAPFPFIIYFFFLAAIYK